jgi:hypothetical protein
MGLLRSLDRLYVVSFLDVCGICVVLATGRSLTCVQRPVIAQLPRVENNTFDVCDLHKL